VSLATADEFFVRIGSLQANAMNDRVIAGPAALPDIAHGLNPSRSTG
jgi:hypothetical protein